MRKVQNLADLAQSIDLNHYENIEDLEFRSISLGDARGRVLEVIFQYGTRNFTCHYSENEWYMIEINDFRLVNKEGEIVHQVKNIGDVILIFETWIDEIESLEFESHPPPRIQNLVNTPEKLTKDDLDIEVGRILENSLLSSRDKSYLLHSMNRTHPLRIKLRPFNMAILANVSTDWLQVSGQFLFHKSGYILALLSGVLLRSCI